MRASDPAAAEWDRAGGPVRRDRTCPRAARPDRPSAPGRRGLWLGTDPGHRSAAGRDGAWNQGRADTGTTLRAAAPAACAPRSSAAASTARSATTPA